MFKRVFLFLATNMAVLALVSIVMAIVGIDPATKTLVFSDGLNLDKAVQLFRHFRGRINTSFGIGTKLTCDLPGVSPMNIVFKLMECNGGPVAKISDSPGKTLCRDADFIRNLKQAFHVGV